MGRGPEISSWSGPVNIESAPCDTGISLVLSLLTCKRVSQKALGNGLRGQAYASYARELILIGETVFPYVYVTKLDKSLVHPIVQWSYTNYAFSKI